MFREMRRKDRALPAGEAEALLARGKDGVLCVTGEDGYPYGVPISYGYIGGKIYLHSATEGYKLDALRKNPKVCFTVVERRKLLPEDYSVDYSSVIVFGTARILADPEEKMDAMLRMMEGLAPEALEKVRDYCVRQSDAYETIVIQPEHLTGKARRGD